MLSLLYNKEPLLQPSAIDARSKGLQTQATISTFLAAVQGQALTSALPKDTTVLLKVTTAFALAGIIMDVYAVFFSLISAMVLMTQAERVMMLRDAVSKSSHSELQLTQPNIARPKTSIGKWMKREIYFHLGNSSSTPRTSSRSNWDALMVEPDSLFKVVEQLGRSIDIYNFIGHSAGMATLAGIVSYAASILCLAIATQPRAVWISSVAVMALFPFLNFGILTMITTLVARKKAPLIRPTMEIESRTSQISQMLTSIE